MAKNKKQKSSKNEDKNENDQIIYDKKIRKNMSKEEILEEIKKENESINNEYTKEVEENNNESDNDEDEQTKETKDTAVIYMVTCLINNKRYIGRTVSYE